MKPLQIFRIPGEAIEKLKAWKDHKENKTGAPWGPEEMVEVAEIVVPLGSDYNGQGWMTHTYYVFLRGAWRQIGAGKLVMFLAREIRRVFRAAGFRKPPKSSYIDTMLSIILLNECEQLELGRPEPKDAGVGATVFGETEVLHIRKTGEVVSVPPDPKLHNTAAITGQVSGKVAPPVEFLKWLDWFTQNDSQLVKVLQELFGYALTPHFLQPYVVFVHGSGRNGKTTLVRVLREVVGKRNTVAVQMQDIDHQTCELFAEALLNVVSESDLSRKPNYDLLKQLCDGDPLTVNPKYRAPRTVWPVSRQWFAVNALPLAVDVSYAWRERMLIIPTPPALDPDQRDPHLLDKFAKEIDGIRMWAVEGLRRLVMQRGMLSKCSRMADAMASYWASATNTGLFWQDFREQMDGGDVITFGSTSATLTEHHLINSASIPCKQAYQLYRAYCEENGYRPKSEKTFYDDTHAGQLSIIMQRKGVGRVYMLTSRRTRAAASAPTTMPADPLTAKMQEMFGGTVESVD